MKLAIIIPAYNCESTIGETLSSLQNIQSGWDSVERVVVCDDASSDNTVSMVQLRRFDRCPLTLLRHKTNKGEAACYGTMMSALSEEVQWFLILHSDDTALPCFLKRNLEILRRCNERVAAVSSNYYVFGGVSEDLAHCPAEDKIIFRGSAKADIYYTATVGCWWHISGSLVNKKAWQQFGGRDPALPQIGDWDLMLRWQMAGHSVGHSLIPTTKCRVNQTLSVSSRSYAEFRDVRERVKVILGHPDVFSVSVKKKWAKELVLASGRRTCKLLLNGRIKSAVGGLSIAAACVARLLRECNLGWLDGATAIRYRAKMYYRWLGEFGIDGLWKLLCCYRSHQEEHVQLGSKQFGSLICRKCPEDFAAINTVMCFDAYRVAAGYGQFRSVLDLGANIGIATRYFLARLPGVSVLAVEPSADNCSVFKMNVAIAEAGNRAQLWECGIGSAEGKGFLKSEETMRFDSFQVEYAPNGQPINGEHTIVVRAMGGVVETLAGPILVKMDIEGSENEVLACRADWIGKVGYMMIEFHDKKKEKMWLSVLAAEGWKSEKHFDTWHFHKHQ